MLHQDQDKRSLAIHIFLCERLRKEPHRLAELREQYEYWYSLPNFCVRKEYADAWLDAVDIGVEEVVKVATQDTDFGQAIRQCSPMGLLWHFPKERLDFMMSWKQENLPRLSIKEAAKYLNKNIEEVKGMMKRNEIKYLNFQNEISFYISELKEYLKMLEDKQNNIFKSVF